MRIVACFAFLPVLAIVAVAPIHAQSVGPIQLVTDINEDPGSGNQGTGDANPKEFYEWRGILYFSANGGKKHGGREPWRSDGTAAGTFAIADIMPGGGSSNPEKFMAAGDLLYFTVDDPAKSQSRLLYAWTGTKLVGPITTTQDGSVEVLYFGMGGRLYFMTFANRSTEIHSTDGKSIYPTGFKFWTDTVVLGSKILMPWMGELGVSDGTAAGMTTIEIYPGSTWASVDDLTVIDGLCYFIAKDKKTDRRHLWVTNGEKSGTKDLTPNLWENFGSLQQPAHSKDLSFFSLADARNGQELWRSDGSASGTEMVKDLHPTAGSRPFLVTPANKGVVFFATTDTRKGLFFSQGYNNFVRPVHDLLRLRGIVSIGDEAAIYLADEKVNGRTDVFLTQRSYPYWTKVLRGNMGDPREMLRAGNYVFFRGFHPTLRSELFATKLGATTTESGPGYGANQAPPSLRLSDPKISQPIEFYGSRAPAASTMIVGVGAPGYGAKLGPCPLYLDVTLPIATVARQIQAPSWSFTIPAPNMPSLIGMQLAVQAAFLRQQLMTTNGLLVYPGN